MVNLLDYLSEESERMLTTFCANKSTGSAHPLDKERWNEFMISVVNKHEDLPLDALNEWLLDDGFSEDMAHKLLIEFENGTNLLKQFKGY